MADYKQYYMYYNGDLYLNDTGIIVKDEYIKAHTVNGKKIWKYYWFSHKTVYNGKNPYVFSRHKISFCDMYGVGCRDPQEWNAMLKTSAPTLIVPCYEINDVIEGFTRPIKVERQQANTMMKAAVDNALHPKSDFEVPGMNVL